MEIDRRGFIGSSIGFFLGTTIPFVVHAAPQIKEDVSWEDRYWRMWHVNDSILKRFKVILYTHDGCDFLGPKIQTIKRNGKFEINFELKDLVITKALIINKIKLLDDENYYIRDINYPIQHLFNGYTLSLSICAKITFG